MESNQELDKLDKIKTEVLKLQETINNFQGEDDVLNRVEEKLDILAQTDYSEIISFSLESLKTDIHTYFENVDNALINISDKLKSNGALCDNSQQDILKINGSFQEINEKLSKILHLTHTNIGENEELNNRFESNLTRFNSGFQAIYDKFISFDAILQKNIELFDSRFQDLYEQFSTIDIRADIDEIKLYIQSFSNKITGVSQIIDGLKENNFSINLDKIDALGDRINDIEKVYEHINKIESGFQDFGNFSVKIHEIEAKVLEIKQIHLKIETLNQNLLSLIAKVDNNAVDANIEHKKSSEVISKVDSLNQNLMSFINKVDENSKQSNSDNIQLEQVSDSIKNELKVLYEKFSSDFSSFSAPLSSVIKVTGSLTELLDSFKADFSHAAKKVENDSEISRKEIKGLYEKFNNEFSSLSDSLASIIEVTGGLNETLYSFKDGLLGSPAELEAFKADISDINTKLNRIILTEKENRDLLANDLDLKNKNLINSITDEFLTMNQKIVEISDVSNKSFDSAETMKNVIVCMADWFDKAGKLIEENNENTKKNSIERINSILARTEAGILDQVKKVSEKMNRLEVRLENIEGRVERIHDNYSARDVLMILSDILEKVEISNERSRANELILKRMERLEMKANSTPPEPKPPARMKKSISEE